MIAIIACRLPFTTTNTSLYIYVYIYYTYTYVVQLYNIHIHTSYIVLYFILCIATGDISVDVCTVVSYIATCGR